MASGRVVHVMSGEPFDPSHAPHPCSCGTAEHNDAIDKAMWK